MEKEKKNVCLKWSTVTQLLTQSSPHSSTAGIKDMSTRCAGTAQKAGEALKPVKPFGEIKDV